MTHDTLEMLAFLDCDCAGLNPRIIKNIKEYISKNNDTPTYTVQEMQRMAENLLPLIRDCKRGWHNDRYSDPGLDALMHVMDKVRNAALQEAMEVLFKNKSDRHILIEAIGNRKRKLS